MRFIKRYLPVLLLAICLPSGTISAQQAVDPALRRVVDMASFSFEQARRSNGQSWVLGMAVPNRSQLGGAEAVQGTFRSLLSLGTFSPEAVRPYAWQCRRPQGGRDLFDHRTSPFRGGGLVICPDPGQFDAEAKVSPAFLLPGEWERYVDPAWRYTLLNSTLFDPTALAANAPRLQQLVTDPNPFLSIAAFRLLLPAGLLNPNTASVLLSAADPTTQSVMTYLLLREAPASQREAVLRALTAVVDAKPFTDADLAGIALGAYAAGAERLGPSVGGTHREVFRHIVRRRSLKTLPGQPTVKLSRLLAEVEPELR